MKQEIFDSACAIQIQLSQQTGAFQLHNNKALWDAAQVAYQDVKYGTTNAQPQLVQSDTGSGKTTFCIALITAAIAELEDYSAAYVVATIDEAQVVFNRLAGLIPQGCIAIHSSAHENEERAASHGSAVLDHVKANGISQRKDLARHRVVICTHELWVIEGEKEVDFGVRRFNGQPRANVFVDEFPDTIETLEIVPSDLDELADELQRVTDYREQSNLARKAARTVRMECEKLKVGLGTAHLLSSEDLAELEAIDLTHLSDARDMTRLRRALNVLKAATSGHCFLWCLKARDSGQADGHMMLVAYTDRFIPHPGLVILDATAKLAPQLLAGQPFHQHGGPPVSFCNLSLTHLEEPPGFETIASRVANADTIHAYAQWIKTTVRANTDTRSTILIVVPKKVSAVLDNANPIPWRQVQVETWGKGVGSNAYRDCDTVFLFAEFHKPRHTYLAQSLASRRKAAWADDLKQAHARCTGLVSEIKNAHRMRQFKQMACRGRVRRVDADGVAAPMRLFTSMDRTLFIDGYSELFPDAPPARFIIDETEAKRTRTKVLAGLLSKVMEPREPITLTTDSLMVETGIKAKDLKRAFNSKQCKPLHRFGWKFIPGNGRKSKPELRFEPVIYKIPKFGTIRL